VQIWPLSFVPCLTHLFVPPCRDPSTRPHIQVSDVLETCKLNFWYYYFPFSVFALWNVVPSTPFSPCSWLDPLNLSRYVKLFPVTYNCSHPVLMCSLTNNLVDLSTEVSWSEPPYFYLDLFSSHFQPTCGAVLLILKCSNNSTFFNVVCISWKLKCWSAERYHLLEMRLQEFRITLAGLPVNDSPPKIPSHQTPSSVFADTFYSERIRFAWHDNIRMADRMFVNGLWPLWGTNTALLWR